MEEAANLEPQSTPPPKDPNASEPELASRPTQSRAADSSGADLEAGSPVMGEDAASGTLETSRSEPGARLEPDESSESGETSESAADTESSGIEVSSLEASSLEASDAEQESSGTPLVQVRDLVKDFGEHLAVKGISFDVDEGEIFGFIGPNGAGKTTTIRMISTLLEPTSGDIHIGGCCALNDTDEVRRMIGFMPDHFGVYEGLTVDEYLEFFARAYRLSAKASRRIIEDVMELTDLGHLRHRLVSTFSKGMKQRLCLAKTLIHDPKLLILDEPASGLDPRARIEFRMLLKELKEMGKTIFISSHILTELSDICTSVGIIESGQLVKFGSVEELKNVGKSEHHVEITLSNSSLEAVDLVNKSAEVNSASLDGLKLTFNYSGERDDFYRVLKLLTDNRVPVLEVHHDTKNLEHLFLELTKGEVT